jgi:hypothetical protein
VLYHCDSSARWCSCSSASGPASIGVGQSLGTARTQRAAFEPRYKKAVLGRKRSRHICTHQCRTKLLSTNTLGQQGNKAIGSANVPVKEVATRVHDLFARSHIPQASPSMTTEPSIQVGVRFRAQSSYFGLVASIQALQHAFEILAELGHRS